MTATAAIVALLQKSLTSYEIKCINEISKNKANKSIVTFTFRHFVCVPNMIV